jgi:hypothetical protein
MEKSKKLIIPALIVASFFFFTHSAFGATKYWIGSSGGSFSDNANWSTTSGGANDTTAPGVSDVATFNSGNTNNVSIDSSISVSGIDIKSTYSGNITQAVGVGITVGTGNFTIAGGTYTGSTGLIRIEGTFSQTGGTFIASSATTTFKGNFTHTSSGTFTHNNGVVEFSPPLNNTYNLTLASTTFNNVVFTTSLSSTLNPTIYLNSGSGMTVEGDMLIYATTTAALVLGSNNTAITPIIYIEGDLIMPGSSGTGTITVGSNNSSYQVSFDLKGDFLMEKSTISMYSRVVFSGTLDQNITKTAGAVQSTYSVWGSTKPSGNLTIVSFDGGSDGFQWINGTVRASSNLTLPAFVLVGGTFIASSGTTTFSSNFTHTGGTFNPNGGIVSFSSNTTNTLTLASTTFNDVTFTTTSTSNGATIILAGDMIVAGDLWGYITTAASSLSVRNNSSIPRVVSVAGDIIIPSTNSSGLLYFGDSSSTYVFTFELGGDLVIQDSGFNLYDPIRFNGTGDQTITKTAGVVFEAYSFWSSIKSSGTLTINSYTGSSGGFKWTGGTVLAGSSLVFPVPFSLTSGTFVASSGTTTFQSTFSHTAGTYNPNGGITAFSPISSSATTHTFASTTFNDVVFTTTLTSSSADTVIAGDMVVAGNFYAYYSSGASSMTIRKGSSIPRIISVAGDVVILNTSGSGTVYLGSSTTDYNFLFDIKGDLIIDENLTAMYTQVIFSGTSTQEIYKNAGTVYENYSAWRSNKTSGTLTLKRFATGGSLTWASGNISGDTNLIFPDGAGFVLTGGTFTASTGTTTFQDNFTRTGGTFDGNGGTVAFSTNETSATYYNFGGITFNNVVFNSYAAGSNSMNIRGSLTTTGDMYVYSTSTNTGMFIYGDLNIQPTFTINGDLRFPSTPLTSGITISQANDYYLINFNVKGDVYMEENSLIFHDPIVLNGTGDQDIIKTGGTVQNSASWSTTNTTGTVRVISYDGPASDFFKWTGGTIYTSGDPDFDGTFILTGGTFVANSATTTYRGPFTYSGGTFNANGGVVAFDNSTGTFALSLSGITFNNLTFINSTINGSTRQYNISGSFTVGGDLKVYTLTGYAPVLRGVSNPTITVNGDLIFPKSGAGTGTIYFGDSTTSNNFTVNLKSDFKLHTNTYVYYYASTTFSGTGNQHIIKEGSDIQSQSVWWSTKSSGTLTIDTWGYAATSTDTLTWAGGTLDISSGITLGSLKITSGTVNSNTDTIIGYTFTQNGGTFVASSATTTFKGGFVYTSGTFNTNGGTAAFDVPTGTFVMTLGGVTFNNLVIFNSTINGSTRRINISGNGTVNGDFKVYTLTGYATTIYGISNPTITVNGNLEFPNIGSGTGVISFGQSASSDNFTVNLKGNFVMHNSAPLYYASTTFSGTGAQTITKTSGNIQFQSTWWSTKTSGTLTIDSWTYSALTTDILTWAGGDLLLGPGINLAALKIYSGTVTSGIDTIINYYFTQNGGTFNASSATTTFKAGFTYTSGTFNHNNGIVAFDPPTGTYTMAWGGVTLNNLTFLSTVSSGSTRQYNITEPLTVAGDLKIYTIGSGYPPIFRGVSNPTVTVNGNFILPSTSGTGSIVIGDFSTSNNFTLSLKGNFIMNASNVPSYYASTTFTGTGDQRIERTAGTILTNTSWTINKPSGTAYLATAIHIPGSIIVTQGTLDLRGNNLTAGGQRTVRNGGTLKLYGSEILTFPTMLSGSTMEYYGTTSPSYNIRNITYHHLIVNGDDSSFLATSTLNVNGNLTISNGTLDIDSFNLVLGASSVFSNDDTFRLRGSETLTNFTNDTDSGTTTYDGGGSYASLVAGNTYNNLSFEGIGSWTTNSDTDVLNNLTVTSGTLVDGGNTISIGGNMSNSGTLTSTGTFDFNKSSGIQTLNGGGVTKIFNNVTKSGGGNLELRSNILRVNGTLTVSTSTTVDLNNLGITLGTLSNNGNLLLEGGETVSITTMDNDSGTTTYDGSGTYTSLSGGDTYYDLKISGSGSWTLDANLNVDGDLDLSNGTLVLGNKTITLASDFLNSSTFTADTGTLTLDGLDQLIGGSNDTTFYNLSKIASATSTLTFDPDITTTISNNTTLKGSPGATLSLRSLTEGEEFDIDISDTGTRDIEYVSVMDSNNINAEEIVCDIICENEGNNTNWAFKPAPPIDVAGTANSSSITWSWTKVGEVETGFRVYTLGGALVGTVDSNTYSYTETNLTPETSYTRYIKAVNFSQESEPSDSVSVTTLATPVVNTGGSRSGSVARRSPSSPNYENPPNQKNTVTPTVTPSITSSPIITPSPLEESTLIAEETISLLSSPSPENTVITLVPLQDFNFIIEINNPDAVNISGMVLNTDDREIPLKRRTGSSVLTYETYVAFSEPGRYPYTLTASYVNGLDQKIKGVFNVVEAAGTLPGTIGDTRDLPEKSSLEKAVDRVYVKLVDTKENIKDVFSGENGEDQNKKIVLIQIGGILGVLAGMMTFSGGAGLGGILAIAKESTQKLSTLAFGFLGVKLRHRPWGAVYDSQTKQPLDPAYVVLFDQKGEKIAEAITDLNGRYAFSVEPGIYRIEASKTNYVFPSKTLQGKIADEVYPNLYFGEEIVVEKQGEIIFKNIPMDPVNFDWNEHAKREHKLNSFFSRHNRIIMISLDILFIFGFIFSILNLLSHPTLSTKILFGLYLILGVIRMFGFGYYRSGVVYEKSTGNPLQFAIIKVLSGDGYVMTEKVTDKYGRYYALVPKGKYVLQIHKKELDGTYSLVYTTGEIKTRGVIRERVKV